MNNDITCKVSLSQITSSPLGFNNPYNDANRKLGGEQLVSSPPEALSSYGQATGYATRSYRAPIALEINWKLLPHGPITFPLNPTYKTIRSSDPYGGERVDYSAKPSTPSSNPGSFGLPSRFHKVTPQLPSTNQLAMPQEVSMPFPSTYIVQFNGRYGRGSNVNHNTRLYKQGPPPVSFGLGRPRRWKA